MSDTEASRPTISLFIRSALLERSLQHGRMLAGFAESCQPAKKNRALGQFRPNRPV